MRIEVWSERGEAGSSEAGGETADVVVEPEGLMQDEHAGVRARAIGQELLGSQRRAVGGCQLQALRLGRHDRDDICGAYDGSLR